MVDVRSEDLLGAFVAAFGERPTVAVRAPGRVNLIGEHTDYNDGFCLPMAIERDVRIALRPRDDQQVRVVSLQESGRADFSLAEQISKDAALAWADYVKGSAQVLLDAGYWLRGCDLAISGNVPLGSGLSSSAALEVACIHAFLAVIGEELPGEQVAPLAQRAENDFVGTKCGIMDQLASACGMAGSALLMDCRSLALTPVPLPKGVAVVIIDSGKRRGLVDSAYNQRRAQCEAGARALGLGHLRDADLHRLRAARADGSLQEEAWQRCVHVVAENGRTQAAAACLRAGDVEALGALMDQSHEDLRQRFAVSCDELDYACELVRALPGCLGARMTGAGFGGCAVALLREEHATEVADALLPRYRERFDLPAAVYLSRAAAGAGPLPL